MDERVPLKLRREGRVTDRGMSKTRRKRNGEEEEEEEGCERGDR